MKQQTTRHDGPRWWPPRLAWVLVAGLALASGACKGDRPVAPKAAPGGTARASAIRADPADWCKGHAIPESMCTKCNPELIEGFKAAGDWCAEHGFPESACPLCNPIAPPGTAPAGGGDAQTGALAPAGSGDARPGALAPGTRVRFRSPDLERAAGIQTVPGALVSMGEVVEVTARVEFDGNALADVRSAVAGIVREVSVDLGQQVAAGDALFVLESAQVGDLQAQVQAARGRIYASRAELRRNEGLETSGAVSAREVEQARQELRAAQGDLASIEQALRLSGAKGSGGAGRFTVRAPIAGSVVRRPALVGTYAAETDSLARIADTSRMWVLLDIPEWDAARVRPGQPVAVRVDGVPGRVFAGALTWMASEVSPRLRTVAARAEVDNADGLLRAGQFAHARVTVGAAVATTSIPLAAVQRVGDDSVVFVRVAQGVYEPRTVKPGRSDGRAVQVAGDVAPGDAVVTTGAYLLRTELSRDSIGAGCCEVDTAGAK